MHEQTPTLKQAAEVDLSLAATNSTNKITSTATASAATTSTATTSTALELPQSNQSPFVSFSLHHTPLEKLSCEHCSYFTCPSVNVFASSRGRRNGGLRGLRTWGHSSAKINEHGVIDFSTKIKTNLNVVFVGDSLAGQYHEWFLDSVAGATNPNRTTPFGSDSFPSHVNWIPNGATFAHLKILSLLTGAKYEESQRWVEENARMNQTQFDICINRFPVPHIQFSDLNLMNMNEVIRNTIALFQCQLVLVLTVPWHNNMQSQHKVDSYYKTNEMIRSTLVPSLQNNTLLPDVHLLDVDAFTRLLVEDNANQIGIVPNETYTVRMSERVKWCPVQAVVCSANVLPTLRSTVLLTRFHLMACTGVLNPMGHDFPQLWRAWEFASLAHLMVISAT
jgi:hypothetical protein